ncbi:MAG: Hemolysin-type calcium-binding region [Devosia sp.]|nr:Hemolysin-type calcium-binding region [Devosia sp.]
MAVIVGGYAPADLVRDSDDPSLMINGAGDFEVISTGLGTFVYVAGGTYTDSHPGDNGLTVFQVASDGTLTAVQNLSHGGGLALRLIDNMTTATVGGRTFLYIEALNDNFLYPHGITCFEVGADGRLTYLYREEPSPEAPLLGGFGDIQSVTVGGTTFVYMHVEGQDPGTPFGSLIDVVNLFRVGPMAN